MIDMRVVDLIGLSEQADNIRLGHASGNSNSTLGHPHIHFLA